MRTTYAAFGFSLSHVNHFDIDTWFTAEDTEESCMVEILNTEHVDRMFKAKNRIG